MKEKRRIISPLALGIYRIFRRFGNADCGFLGILFLVTMVVVCLLHARVFELAHLFVPLLSAGAVFGEEMLARVKLRRAFGTVIFSCLRRFYWDEVLLVRRP